jgi:hypothetical protein
LEDRPIKIIRLFFFPPNFAILLFSQEGKMNSVTLHEEPSASIHDIFPKNSYEAQTVCGLAVVREGDDLIFSSPLLGLEWYQIVGPTGESVRRKIVTCGGLLEIDDPIFLLRLVGTSPKQRGCPTFRVVNAKTPGWVLWLARRFPRLKIDIGRVKVLNTKIGDETFQFGSNIGAKLLAQQRAH